MAAVIRSLGHCRAVSWLTSLVVVLSVLHGARCSESAASVRRCRTDLPQTTDVRIRGDICYQFVYREKYWTDARDYCMQYGGRLIKIDDTSTNEFVLTTLKELPWPSNNGIWIGLNDRSKELTWRWATSSKDREEEVNWTNWGKGHPGARLHGIRDCIRMVRSDTWKWHETPCDMIFYTYRFICEYQMPPVVAPPTPAYHWGKSTQPTPATTTTTTTRAPTPTTTTTPVSTATPVPTPTELPTPEGIEGRVVNSNLGGVRPGSEYHYRDEELYVDEHYIVEVDDANRTLGLSTSSTPDTQRHWINNGAAVMEFKGDDESTKKSKFDAMVAIVCVVFFLSSVFLLIVFLVVRRRRQNRRLAMMGAVAVAGESTDDEEGYKKPIDKIAAEDKLTWKAIFHATRPHASVKATAAEPNAYCDIPRRFATTNVECTKQRSSPEELLPEPPQGSASASPQAVPMYIPMFGGSPYEKIPSERHSVNMYVPMTVGLNPVAADNVAYANEKSTIPEEGDNYENGRIESVETDGESSGEDCGMGGYDMPKPTNIYAEIPGSDRQVEESHIYECLDDIKVRVQSGVVDAAET